MEAQINQVIEKDINPLLASHFGSAVLTKIVGGVVYIKMDGACATCPSAQITIEEVVKQKLMEKIPEIEDVVLDTSVSEDLLEMAKKILNK